MDNLTIDIYRSTCLYRSSLCNLGRNQLRIFPKIPLLQTLQYILTFRFSFFLMLHLNPILCFNGHNEFRLSEEEWLLHPYTSRLSACSCNAFVKTSSRQLYSRHNNEYRLHTRKLYYNATSLFPSNLYLFASLTFICTRLTYLVIIIEIESRKLALPRHPYRTWVSRVSVRVVQSVTFIPGFVLIRLIILDYCCNINECWHLFNKAFR